MANQKVNVVIVGAGAGGGVVAKELSTAGMSVVLFERGSWISYDDHTDDELLSERNPVLGNSCGPDDQRNRRVNVHFDGSSHIVLPSEGDYNNISACVGSGTVTYGALAWRYMREDFKMRSTYGDVPGSTLEDWPISYEDLEPFYEKAEWEIGVSGDDSQNLFAPPQKETTADAPFYTQQGGINFKGGCIEIRLSPFFVTHVTKFNSLWRSTGLLPDENLYRICLSGWCKSRNSQYGDSGCIKIRELRIKNKLCRFRNKNR